MSRHTHASKASRDRSGDMFPRFWPDRPEIRHHAVRPVTGTLFPCTLDSPGQRAGRLVQPLWREGPRSVCKFRCSEKVRWIERREREQGHVLLPMFTKGFVVAGGSQEGRLDRLDQGTIKTRRREGKAKGMGARRESVSPAQFLSLQIPLPPLPEQQAIVSRLNMLTEKTQQVSEHLDTIERDADRLLRAYIFRPLGETPARRPMAELLTLRQPDVRVDRLQRYHFAGVYSFGRGVFASVSKDGSEFA